MTEQTQHFINTIFGSRGYDKSIRQIDRYGNKLAETQTKTTKIGGKLYTETKKWGKNNEYLGSTIAQATVKQNDFVLAMKRALIVAPVWMITRAAMMKVLEAIKDIVKTYKELDEGMRKVMAVATFTGETQSRIYTDLEHRARVYFSTSASGMKDITESMYQLGTAGLSTEQIMGGFEHVMNLAIGTFGDVTTAGRLMAGVFNVFGDELKRVGDEAQQMQYVADLLATAWKNNQIELNEINTAMGYLAASGKIVGLGLKELIAASSVMSDALLRGGKGGRLLARAFVQIAKQGRKLADIGVYFDPSQPLDFYNVMGQLHDKYTEHGRSLGFLNTLVDIFGVRGIRAVGGVLEMWEKFNEEIKRTPEEIEGAAAKLKESAEKTWPKIFAKAWHLAITTPDLREVTLDWKGLAQEFFQFKEAKETGKMIAKIREMLLDVGDEFKISKDVAADLARILASRGFGGLASEITKQFKISSQEFARAGKDLEWTEKMFMKLIALHDEWKKSKKEAKYLRRPEVMGTQLEIEAEDSKLKALKDQVKYGIMQLQGASKTSIMMEKIAKLLNEHNKGALKVGRAYGTIGDVLSLNKTMLEGTQYTEELLNLGKQTALSAEEDRQKIIKALVNAQLDELKAQGATLEQRIQAKILFEDSLGKQRDIVASTKNELDLRKAINAQKEVDIRLSAQTMKLAQIAEERGVDVAKELGELLQGRVKWAEFEAEAMNETWDALVKFFPQILKQQRAMQLLITGADPYAGRRFEGAREIPIKEEYLRAPLEQNKLMVRTLEKQVQQKEIELQKQREDLEKKAKEEYQKLQLEELKKIAKNVSAPPAFHFYYKGKPISKEELGIEIKTDGTPIANAIDDRIEK